MPNRPERRKLERAMRKAGGTVRLRGGPMDDWLVKEKAAALHPDWHTTWPENYWPKPGRYELTDETDGEARIAVFSKLPRK